MTSSRNTLGRCAVWLALVVLFCASGARAQDEAAAFGGARDPADSLPLHGALGLYVTRSADTLRIAWLTRQAGAGWAQLASVDGGEEERTSPAGTAHAVRFLHPADDTVLLRYGSLDDPLDRHEITLRLSLHPERPPTSYEGVDSIFVMGDVHGELDTLRAVLRNAGVVGDEGRWSGGRAHLVVVGDMVDRGRDATGVLWFLYGLQPQAEGAGGRLDVLLGNHEIMVLLDDLRYVHPKELSLAAAHGVAYDRLFDPRRSILGTWLVSKPAIVRIDDVLFAHGGVSSDYLDTSLQAFDDSLAAYTGDELFYRWADTTYATPPDSAGLRRRNQLFWRERSPLWYRAYVMTDTVMSELSAVLEHFDARLHVVGHTPLRTISERYGGALIDVNTAPFAAELLLLVRREEEYERWRFRSSGPPERLDTR